MSDRNEVASSILGAVSIVLGIISIFIFWWLSIIGIVLGVIGIILVRDYDKGKAPFLLPLTGTILTTILFVVSLILLF